MKRLILEGDWTLSDSGKTWSLPSSGRGQAIVLAELVTLVEDLPDPLPTQPGVRFWGKAQDHPAEWWFVIEITEDGDEQYISQSGFRWNDVEAERFGLARLPDPERDR